MISLFQEAAELQESLQARGLDFYFVGGIALQVWGQPRLTTDIDLTVFTGLSEEDEQIRWFLENYEPLIGDSDSTLEFARVHRVLLLRTRTGVEVDIMLGGLADISEELRRSSLQSLTPLVSLKICSAETLIAMKTIAGRFQDLADIETVIVKQRNLDWAYIDQYLDQVLQFDDRTGNVEVLHRLKDQFYEKG